LKLHLPNVTLVMIETREHKLARLAIADSIAKVDFAEVLIFTDKPEEFSDLVAPLRFIAVPDWEDKLGWSRCNWQEVSPHLETAYALGIQWDSWVVDATMWRDEFLAFDYIGAPWWYKDGMNVGNGGFCIRSAVLMRYLRKHRDKYPCLNALDDDLLCRKYRPTLQERGFTWAPETLAIDFAVECEKMGRERHFGFHAAFNFEFGCDGDRKRILERARLMAASHYITKGDARLWNTFIKANPWVTDALNAERDEPTETRIAAE